MVNKSQHTIPSKEKLLAFVRGELSAKERMDIAKAIEENPILADAVEGLRLSLNREKNILELEQAVRKKFQNSNRGKIISFQSKAILAAAASVLILISIGIYNKMLKLDEGRVVSEQTFKNTKAPTEIIKATEGSANSEEAAEAESAPAAQTIAPNFNFTEQQKSEQKNKQEKATEKTEIAKKLESPMEETKAQQAISTNSAAMLADGDKDYNAKKDASGRAAVNDNTAMANAPAPASSTITRDIPKREESDKKKTERYRSAEQAPAAAFDETIQEKESTKKSLAREVPDPNSPFNQAIALHNRRNFEAAFFKMDSLVQKNSKNDEYQYYAGVFAYDNKLYEKAINYLEPLSKNTKSKFQESAKWYLALSYKALGKTDKAKLLLKEFAAKNNGYQQLAADSLKAME
jgi:hypothetical protein